MSDVDHDDTDTGQPAPVPFGLDEFSRLDALLRLMVDPKANLKHLRALRRATMKTQRAEESLAAARAVHDQAIAAERAEIEAERAAVRKQRMEVLAERGQLEHSQEVLADERRTLDLRSGRFEHFPGGLTRQYPEGEPRDEEVQDAHERTIEEPAFSTERVSGQPTELSRTVYREPARSRGRRLRNEMRTG